MNIAFCSTGTDRTSKLDQRFGRTEFFVVINTETNEVHHFVNEAKNASGGAGPQAIQQLVDNNIEIVIAPEIGPKAYDAMVTMGIKAYAQGQLTTIEEAYTAWKNNDLQEIQSSTGKGLHRA